MGAFYLHKSRFTESLDYSIITLKRFALPSKQQGKIKVKKVAWILCVAFGFLSSPLIFVYENQWRINKSKR